MTLALAKYDAMRLQVAQCARVDEAAELRNRADKLRAYAKQKKDHELHRWMGEIFCRATLRYGELSKGTEKAKNGTALPSGGKSKKAQIKASGLSTSAAQRAEALAGARSDLDDQMQVEALGIALETAEIYFQQCRTSNTTPNQRQLSGIVDRALDDRFGKPGARTSRWRAPCRGCLSPRQAGHIPKSWEFAGGEFAADADRSFGQVYLTNLLD